MALEVSYTAGRFGIRRTYIYIGGFITAFIIFLLTSPQLVPNSILEHTTIDAEGNVFSPPPREQLVESKGVINTGNSTGKYDLVFVIVSETQDIMRRKLLRKELFGIKDNLIPCWSQGNLKVYYKFLVKAIKPNKKHPANKDILRDFKSEAIEFNDVEEINPVNGTGLQEAALNWANKLKIEYNQLVIADIYTVVHLEKLQISFEKSILNERILTPEQKQNLLWGSFSILPDDTAVVLGFNAVAAIIEALPQITKNVEMTNINTTNILTKAYYYFRQKYPNPLHIINDPIGIIEWANNLESVSPETTFAVGHIYQDGEFTDLSTQLNIVKTSICLPPSIRQVNQSSSNTSSIVITTSSFVYKDNCMIDAVVPAADNKREYAQKHGYHFVPRSAEFAQQIFRNRKTVWGKIDAVEKILPHYDWLFWLDIDAVIVNLDITLESLLEKFVQIAGGSKLFEEKHFIVAKPKGDGMINAGVFLLRNSDWSSHFLREVQGRKEQYFGKFYEQRALWDVMREPKWKDGALLLSDDDHTFNTFPQRYEHGDFIVHFAPDGCPAKPVMMALNQIKNREKNPDIKEKFKT